MTYSIALTYNSLESTTSYGVTDVIDVDDRSCADFWTDLGDSVAKLIAFAERNLFTLYPDGHTYVLSNIDINLIGDDDE